MAGLARPLCVVKISRLGLVGSAGPWFSLAALRPGTIACVHNHSLRGMAVTRMHVTETRLLQEFTMDCRACWKSTSSLL